MTVVDPGLTAPPAEPAATGRADPLRRVPPSVRFVLYGALLILVLTTAEQLTDTSRLTLANTWESALQLTVPIALAGLGGLWSERAGVVNIGLEGMMVLGTWMGAWGCIEFGAWAGVVAGVLGGALGGLLHAVATIAFGVDHIVSGVAVNILGAGIAQFLNLETFASTNQSPTIPENVGRIRVPGLNDVVGGVAGGDLTSGSLLAWLALSTAGLVAAALWFHPGRASDDGDGGDGDGDGRGSGGGVARLAADLARPALLGALAVVVALTIIELAPYLDDQERFFVSELGRIVIGLTAEVSLVVVVGVLAFPASAFVLWRTKFGLRLRAVGEDPVAAASLGVWVYLTRFVAVTISGALAGLGGVSLVYVFAQKFQSGQTNGRGYIGLAAMIFGNWLVGGLVLGAGLFGFMDAMQSQVDATAHAMLLVAALLFGVIAVHAALGRRWRSAVIVAVVAAAFGVWYGTSDSVPTELIPFLPHVTTLAVLVFSAQRLRPPAADGRIFRRSR
ncbi:MAG TPA: ABC transporter permease [Acidimicrobiales bacterium]|nr:ABC transporter permease [Acidimicrobiales bacterium]